MQAKDSYIPKNQTNRRSEFSENTGQLLLIFKFNHEDCFEKAFHYASHIHLGHLFCDLDSGGSHYKGLRSGLRRCFADL